MKILFVHNKYLLSAGGEDTVVAAETKLLQEHGHDVRVLFFDNATMDEGMYGKIKAGIQAVYNRASARRIKKEITLFRPDIIHIHNFFFTASPAVIIEAHRQKVPVIVTLHNYRLVCTNALLLRNNEICERCLHLTFPWHGVKYKCYHDSAVQSAMVGAMGAVHKLLHTWQHKVDRYLVPAAFIKSKLSGSSLHIPAEKIAVKRNFVEESGFSGRSERQDFFLFVGRLSKEKGVHILLQCFEKLPHIKLVIAGDGPEKDELIRQFGHLPNVTFKGQVERKEVVQLLKTCQALVFPSIWYEGLPVTIIEAFATGTPVIASRLGAMEEMIQHGINGWLFEKANVSDLKEMIVNFHAETTDEHYSAAYQSYLDHFHPLKCYEEVMRIYNLTIQEKSGIGL